MARTSDFGTNSDSTVNVRVAPFNGPGILVAFTNVSHQLSTEVWSRREHSSCDYIAFNLGKTVFDLVEPKILGRV